MSNGNCLSSSFRCFFSFEPNSLFVMAKGFLLFVTFYREQSSGRVSPKEKRLGKVIKLFHRTEFSIMFNLKRCISGVI